MSEPAIIPSATAAITPQPATYAEGASPAPMLRHHASGDPRFGALDTALQNYEYEPTALIQVLHVAQQLFGYLSADVIRYIASGLKLPLAHVYGVITFYHLFTIVPRGKHQILVCRGTACHVRGGQLILERLKQELGIQEGETTKDSLLSLHSARCIGACALAPAMSVDEDVYGKLTPHKITQLCQKELRKYV